MNDLARFADIDPLKKPVNTLAIVPQNRKITALGRKAYNVMLNIAQAQGVDKESYRAPLSEIVSGIDYGSNDIELIKKHLKAMATTIVEWNSPTTGEGTKWTVCALISHATIVKESNQNFLEWGYAQPLRQELLSPSVFSKLSIGMLSQMHTHAGIVLYEICTRYKNVGRTSRQNWRWWLPVLTGQPNSEKLAKTEYRFFKRDTIKPAIAEVCAITDIEIELVEYKEGKSISDLQFLVRSKAQVQLPLKSPPKPLDLSIIKKAVDLGISEEKAEDLFTKHGDDAMRDGLMELEGRVASAYPGPVRDPYRYLKAMLSGELQKQIEAQVDPVEAQQLARDESDKKQVELKTAWREEWQRRQREKVVGLLQEQSEESIKELEAALLEEMEERNAHPSLIKRLQASGWNHQLVRHLMIDFYAQAALGEEWDSPTPENLLDIASEANS
ncbi:MAG: RepB family plasmid replication initiator protein [Burkholderiaceae bacterium]|uniref:RepB family plasmid replication initiator protein n=1 Tax=Rhodoferax sp. TaxID=50421 RepID=UPI001ED1B06B|nr:RepB family plasmid replication initiator protein [Rhodoferax sp.]MBT9505028.1 RepB family plasmid replication initiator protein [Rhodoferax sp.]MDO8767696.1 RepB family plasmid replication initiator protein [Burkholderiaceae bacterium]